MEVASSNAIQTSMRGSPPLRNVLDTVN
jgi:hypothetical protein